MSTGADLVEGLGRLVVVLVAAQCDAEAEASGEIVLVELERAAKLLDCVGETPLSERDLTDGSTERRRFGQARLRRREHLLSLLGLAFLAEEDCERDRHLDELGSDGRLFDGVPVHRQSSRPRAARLERAAVPERRRRVLRTRLNERREHARRLLDALEHELALCSSHLEHGVRGVRLGPGFEPRERLRVAAGAKQCLADSGEGARRSRIRA